LAVNSWGFGAAPLLKPATTEDTEIVVFLSDVHVPYHDVAAVQSAVRLLRKVRPHTVVVNGDMNDFFQLSRFNTEAERMDHLQEEIDEANSLRAAIRKACPDARFIENDGNHDTRIRSYVAQNARALTSLRALEPRNLFDWDKLDILNFPGAGFRLRPNFLVKHGTLVRAGAGTTAKAELQQAGISGISGHTHRLGTHRKVGYQHLQWTEQGCLCRLDPAYVVGIPDWSHAVVVGQFSTKTDSFLVEEVQAMDGRFIYGGKAV
jgi:predicted phosphodiesterase